MDYCSFTFAKFLATVLVVYLALPLRLQNLWLLGSSFFFYFRICDAGPFAWCLLISIATEFTVAQRIAATPDRAEKRRWLWFSVAVELAILGWFKLNGFFADRFVPFLHDQLGLHVSWPFEHVALPLAISFYTFQCLGYTIDVYRGQQKPETDFFDFALFVVLFFQLVAGPIERAKKLLPQIKQPRHKDVDTFVSGLWLIFLGVYKKLGVADQLFPWAWQLLPPGTREWGYTYHGIDVLLSTTLGALAMYADFSGYTDAMRGLGRLFGFDVSPNFKAPFLARNIQEYWGRWHITLTLWIRDYLYFPMVLHKFWKRLGSGGLAIATMLIMGFWHGAKLSFLLWGLWHGTLIALYGKLRPWLNTHTNFTNPLAKRLWVVACVLTTFACAVLGGILFNGGEWVTIKRQLRDVIFHPVASEGAFTTFAVCLVRFVPILVLDLLENASNQPDRIATIPWPWRRLIQAVMVGLLVDAVFKAMPSNPFQYF